MRNPKTGEGARVGEASGHTRPKRREPGRFPGRALEILWLADFDENANYLFQISAATPKKPSQPRKRDRDRAERMRLAGGPAPSLREKAYAFARQHTIVRTCEFTAIGIPRHYLAWMCEEGLLVKVGYGRYRAAERKAA